MQISALQRPTSLVEEVCTRLSDLILGQPNHERSDVTWLPAERALAQQLGVSRTVVREATKRLEQQGLLEIQHGTGIKIIRQLHRPLSDSLALLIPDLPSRLRQLNQTRRAIEPAAAALAARNATSEQLLATRAAHQRLATAASNEEAIQADIEWHHLVAVASGNQVFSLILDSLADIGLESRLRTIGHIGKAPAVEHHAIIQKALEERNANAASAAMESHLEAALRDLQLDEYQP
jgi:DNA-binding FadR family transcriptional regulator